MRSLSRSVIVALVVLLGATEARAFPLLQLDIIGGYYDETTDTIVASSDTFTLVALLTPKPGAGPLATLLADTYFISAAVTPQMSNVATNIGSYSWNGVNYNATSSMTYGTPPLELLGEAHHDPGDLAPHSIFPTFFNEFAFQFSDQNRTLTYDSAVRPGGLTPTSATSGVSYFQTFNITTSMSSNHQIHFDLYDTMIKRCALQGTCAMDEDIEHFAPFSHDAQSASVPVPATLALTSLGLLLAIAGRRKLSL